LEARRPEREPRNTKAKTDETKIGSESIRGKALWERYNKSRGRMIRDKSRKEVVISK